MIARHYRKVFGVRWPVSFDPREAVFWFNFGWVALMVFLVLGGLHVSGERFLHRLGPYHWLIEALCIVSVLLPTAYFFLMQPLRRTLEQRNSLTTAIEKSGNIFVIVDKAGNVKYANDRFMDVNGYSKEDLPSLNWRSFLFSDGTSQAEADLLHAIEKGEYWSGELRFKKKNDEIGEQYGVVSGVRNEAGAIERYLILSQDITEQQRAKAEKVQLEEELRQAQKMESFGRLAGGIAHDYNNILSVILNYGDFVSQQLNGQDPVRADVEEIRQAALRAVGLTRRLLIFSRRDLPKVETLCVNDVVREMEKILRRTIGEDITLKTDLADDLNDINMDRGHLEQILMNFFTNSRDAMPSGGKIVIETSNVSVDEAYASQRKGVTPGEYVQLSVSDNGIGMNAETAARIFEPFFTTKPSDKGTGLGLSVVYGIIKQSLGNVWVYSEPAKGTTFKVLLPVTKTHIARVATEAQPAVSAGNGELVLLAEDDPKVRNITRRILEMGGYRVLPAEDGMDAFHLFETQRKKPDLVVTDIIMPQISGPLLVKKLRAIDPKVKVLFMSGYSGSVIEHHEILESKEMFLQKPFTRKELLEKVNQILRQDIARRRAGSPKLV
ncbi:MAG TPA: ATP-binding protein [Bdellovibrionota bacterium]|nr:ATP-binding protein [Bdellovibrionota bacterium]